MKTLNVVQGTPEWKAARAKRRCASDAPFMMGASTKCTRNELIRLEADIQEQCSKEDINFPSLLDKLDKVALLERRKTQYESVLAQLFPAKT